MQDINDIATVSGSTDNNIVAPYDFTITEVFQEAWQRTYGFKSPVLGAVILIFIAFIALGFASFFAINVMTVSSPAVAAVIIYPLNILITLASYPIYAGFMMMGLHRAINAPVNFKMIFSYFSYSLPLIIACISISIMIMLGFFLLIIPGIYLSFAYIFTLPLIIEKDMDFWQAMTTSQKAVHQHWFKIFFTYLLMAVIYFISAIPFGIGLIWTLPLFVALQGVLYRRIFGITSLPAESNNI